MLDIPTTSGGRLYLETGRNPQFYGYAWSGGDIFAIRVAERKADRVREAAIIGRPAVTSLFTLEYHVGGITSRGFPRPANLERRIDRFVVSHILEDIDAGIEKWAPNIGAFYWMQVERMTTDHPSSSPLLYGWQTFEGRIGQFKRETRRNAKRMIEDARAREVLPWPAQLQAATNEYILRDSKSPGGELLIRGASWNRFERAQNPVQEGYAGEKIRAIKFG